MSTGSSTGPPGSPPCDELRSFQAGKEQLDAAVVFRTTCMPFRSASGSAYATNGWRGVGCCNAALSSYIWAAASHGAPTRERKPADGRVQQP